MPARSGDWVLMPWVLRTYGAGPHGPIETSGLGVQKPSVGPPKRRLIKPPRSRLSVPEETNV
jgi:hypothetical protein